MKNANDLEGNIKKWYVLPFLMILSSILRHQEWLFRTNREDIRVEYSCFRQTSCILLTQVQSSRIKFTVLSVSRSSSKLSFAFAFEIESKYAFSPLQKLSETAKTISSSDPRFVLPKDCKFPKKISRSFERIPPPPRWTGQMDSGR